MDVMLLSTVHRHRILKGAVGTSFRDVGSLREDRLKYSTVLSVRCDLLAPPRSSVAWIIISCS